LASRRARLAGVSLAVGLFALLIYVGNKPASNPVPDPASKTPPEKFSEPINTSSTNKPFSKNVERPASPMPPHPESVLLGTERLSPPAQARLVAGILDSFRESEGAYPTAEDNPGVIRQLLGENSTRRAFLSPDTPAINAEGALLDAEGSPYHFHFISSQELELRSAGPDGQLYSEDDILISSHQ